MLTGEEAEPDRRPVKCMTRQLLIALVLVGLVGLALGGAFVHLARGKRPALLSRRDPAFV
jgi:hypothetical protein